MGKYEKGKVVKGRVTGIEDYGVFVSFDDFYSGLIHISEISYGFVKDINDILKVDDVIYTEILEVDDDSCHLKLSIKNIDHKKKSNFKRTPIVEPEHGFETLKKNLPKWIEENLSKK